MDVEFNYEIPRVANFIRSNNFTRVALQFPDELLKDSTLAVKALRQVLDSSVKLYVMADTTYGSCCVDEVGATHANAECVIHFGHTCLSPTSTLPALFIFGKSSINGSHCVENLLDCGLKSGKPVLLLVAYLLYEQVLFGLEYVHTIPEIKEALTACISSLNGEFVFADAKCSVISPSGASVPQNQLRLYDNQLDGECSLKGTYLDYTMGGLSWRLPEGRKMEDYLLFWIGLDNTAFANVLLTFNSCETVRYAPNEVCLVTDLSQQKKVLKRRYYLVEKAKDANMIGILVGTLGAAGYLHMIHHMKELITKAGKKPYTFVMGKPNPSKLANFPECDLFINIACSQTALLDSKEFFAPIITPYEAMLALDRGSQWTGEYVMEFQDLIGSTHVKAREQPEEARFSFLQGGYVEDLELQGT
ncbi:diphthamide biosynthesis protein 2 [Dorcoceras hygrometricum]|nr:diphthamide biosynthesis protein 2 [Dorcoceras hygrometricum]